MELMALAADPSPDIAPDSLDRLIGMLGWWWARTEFSMGALNSVILGGKLHLVRNEELRKEIAGWHSEIDQVHLVESQDYTTFHEDLVPYLRGNTYLAQISSQTIQRAGRTDPIPTLAVPLRPEGTDHRRLLQDPEFHNLLVQRWWVQLDALFTYENFEGRLDQVITRLENELGVSGRETH